MDGIGQINSWANIPVSHHLFLFSPMIALVATMLAVVTAPLIVGRSARTISAIVWMGIVLAFVLAMRVAGEVADGGASGLSTLPGAGLLVVDNLSVAFQIILLIFLGGVMWLWGVGSAEREDNAPEFFVLLLGSALGMALMASTSNLLMIVIAIETASLPSYAIVGFDKRDGRAAEASLKYMVFGAVSAAIMLYGASLIYGLVGSLSVADVAAYTVEHLAGGPSRLVLMVSLLCFMAGIAFKISAVPFHFWCPDAFEGAKIEVTTWLSVASKAAGLVLLARIVWVFCAAVDQPASLPAIAPLAWGIGIMAAVTCTVGNYSAYQQQSVKRLLAYSSIAHAGYMMMAAAVFLYPGNEGYHAGITALLAYIVIYLFMNLGAFGVTALVIWDTGSDNITSFTGLARRAPWLATPMIICLISLVGLPPFAGFMAKWWVLLALGKLNSTLGWLLIVVAALNTLLSLYYYLRIVVQMALRDDGQPALRSSVGGMVLVNVCAAALLVLFVFARPLKSATDGFARNLVRTTTASDVRDVGNVASASLPSTQEIAITSSCSQTDGSDVAVLLAPIVNGSSVQLGMTLTNNGKDTVSVGIDCLPWEGAANCELICKRDGAIFSIDRYTYKLIGHRMGELKVRPGEFVSGGVYLRGLPEGSYEVSGSYRPIGEPLMAGCVQIPIARFRVVEDLSKEPAGPGHAGFLSHLFRNGFRQETGPAKASP